MDAHEQAIENTLAQHARGMSDYHGKGFTAACRAALEKRESQFGPLTDNVLATVVASFARDYMQGVEQERARIRGIDAMAASLLPGHEEMVRAAKFTAPCTAGELAEQIIGADRALLHRQPTAKQ